MAKFEVQPGEQVMERTRIGRLSNKRGSGELILTDRRLVVVDSNGFGWLAFFGWLGFLYAAARLNKRIHCDLPRGSLAQLELFGDRTLVLHTHGEGYAAQHIQINITDAERWKGRLVLWNAGTAGAAPLPTARVIEH